MKLIPVVLAALMCGPALAADPFLTGEALQAEVKKGCADGCIVLNREEVEAMDAMIAKAVRARMEAAYEAGHERCKRIDS